MEVREAESVCAQKRVRRRSLAVDITGDGKSQIDIYRSNSVGSAVSHRGEHEQNVSMQDLTLILLIPLTLIPSAHSPSVRLRTEQALTDHCQWDN
jgi:hypothetical protein